ncbi:MAG: NINE protein [Oscillospiraceae bacterium]
MAVFKCKMCGGDLDVVQGMKVIQCDYCGTSQTVAGADDEKKVNLFNRANSLRINSEFDKAEALYESIIADFPNEAEAYWGICLCKYGIEYVDDPRTKEKIPTCHRTSFKSIYDDESYINTLKYSDASTRQMYCAEAKAIDDLQRDILRVVNNVEPYDVFICYKETGADGQRTKDSVMAQDIYDALTEKGYKVFFARITLEDKLGQEYEPYIFAALNSAKVMLAIGTRPEHFEAVWVKNEWSRYLDLMGSDREKTLIPCYCDMDAYAMPSEFRNLQGQDMGKIGFRQDLVRGIGKILGDSKPASSPVTSAPLGLVTFESTVAAHTGPSIISRVGAMGTNDVNDLWPAGSLSSTIDMAQYSVVMFQIYLRQPIGYNGQAKLGYAIFDPSGNVLNSDEIFLDVQSSYDRFSQGIILHGSDGSKVQTGQYRAVFWIDNSQAAVFYFEVVESRSAWDINNGYYPQQTNNYSVPTYSNPKSKWIAIALAFFFGTFGIHDFYLGHKKRGILRIVLTMTGYGAIITYLWSLVDCILLFLGKTTRDADGNPIE